MTRRDILDTLWECGRDDEGNKWKKDSINQALKALDKLNLKEEVKLYKKWRRGQLTIKDEATAIIKAREEKRG